jgi:hypothetical protein
MHRRAGEPVQAVVVQAAAVPEAVQRAEARPVAQAWAAAARAAGPTEPEWAARPEATQWAVAWEPGQAPHPI